MEINGKNLLGLPVFAIDNGQKLGQVKDYLFDPAAGRLVAFFVSRRGLLKDDLLLPLADVKHIGAEAATVERASLLVSGDDRSEWAPLIKALPDLVGLPLMTEDGVFLGKTTEFRVESESGEITGVELVTVGHRRRLLLRREDILVFGSDVVLVRKDAQRRVTGSEKEGKKRTVPKPDLAAVKARLRPRSEAREEPVTIVAPLAAGDRPASVPVSEPAPKAVDVAAEAPGAGAAGRPPRIRYRR